MPFSYWMYCLSLICVYSIYCKLSSVSRSHMHPFYICYIPLRVLQLFKLLVFTCKIWILWLSGCRRLFQVIWLNLIITLFSSILCHYCQHIIVDYWFLIMTIIYIGYDLVLFPAYASWVFIYDFLIIRIAFTLKDYRSQRLLILFAMPSLQYQFPYF